jgi:biotin carboxyl carrier protein
VRYEVTHKGETRHVEVREAGAAVYDVSVDGAPPVRVDAFKTQRTVYSLLINHRQYEGSVDELDDGNFDVHLGSSAYQFAVVDERTKLLVGAGHAVAVGRQEIRAQMPGKIVKLLVAPGESVSGGQALVVIEAMKMENEIRSPIEGVVTEISVSEGDAVETGAALVTVEPESERA